MALMYIPAHLSTTTPISTCIMSSQLDHKGGKQSTPEQAL